MTIDLSCADELLTTTRGVRRRLDFDKPVARSILEECVDIALQAPVGSAASHFLILLDDTIKQQVAKFYRQAAIPYIDELEKSALSPAPRGSARFWSKNAGPDQIRKVHNNYRWFNSVLHRAPALVIVVGEGRLECGSLFDQATAYGEVIPAAWSFMLAARSRGLGALWTTLHLKYAAEIGELLGVPENYTQVVLLPVGYYKGERFGRATRRPAAETIHWDRW